jgi:predicted phage terminase large subunit-like protein
VEDEVIPLTRGRTHVRSAEELLHPSRESRETLERQRAEMGSSAFEAQYQQAPVPALGNTFRADWLKAYDIPDVPTGGEIVQSWDTGIKTGERNSFSVCITARIVDRQIYVLDIWRGRLEFPDLKKQVIELARLHGAHTMLVEDRASGQELLPTLRSELPSGVPLPLARQPATDKLSRAEGVSSIVETGQLLLPREAHWLGEFKAELLAFPSCRFDDQVDALTQLLAWLRERWSVPADINAGPILWSEEDGYTGEGAESLNRPGPKIEDPWGA